jgi:hypothetical protein
MSLYIVTFEFHEKTQAGNVYVLFLFGTLTLSSFHVLQVIHVHEVRVFKDATTSPN